MDNQQPQQYGNSIQAREERSPLEDSAHIWALNSNNEIAMSFLNSLQGKIFDYERKTWILLGPSELFCDECKLQLYALLSSIVNSSNSMGFTKDKQIDGLLVYNMGTFNQLLSQNRKIWKLKRYQIDTILMSISNMEEVFLSKTLEGNTANMHFGKNRGLNENITHSDSFDTGNNSIGGTR